MSIHLVAARQEVVVPDVLAVLPSRLERREWVRRRVERVEQLLCPAKKLLHLVRREEVGQCEVPAVSYTSPSPRA